MRLIRTEPPFRFKEFMDNELRGLEYAILSHRWDDSEVSFQEMIHPTDTTRQKKGYQKIEKFCERAHRDGFIYAWVDTCCINKESSTELSESINSMFRWYRDAGKCYAYMMDVAIPSNDDFSKSVWFTRGWTLQELIAPKDMVFLANDWTDIGPRRDFSSRISQITKIDEALLLGEKSLDSFCVSKRMSWAAGRETSRAEDRAYSLMGIFGINMPLLYGEGNNAFIRLQEEIMKDTSDETLFAWEDKGLPEDTPCGLLAPSPDCFAESAGIEPYPLSQGDLPFVLTNRGIRMQSPLIPPDSSTTTLILQCVADSTLVGITIKPKPNSPNVDDCVRIGNSLLRGIPPYFLHDATLHTKYIAKSFLATPADKPDLSIPIEETGSESQSDPPPLHRLFHRRIKPEGQFKKIILLFNDTAIPHHAPVDGSGRASRLHSIPGRAVVHGYPAGDMLNLNILAEMLRRANDRQITYYEPWRHKKTVARIVSDAYRFLGENHQPGDEISMFSFGKGCHAVITLCDILQDKGISKIPRSSDWVRLYETQKDLNRKHSLWVASWRKIDIERGRSREPGRIQFIGLFDPVKSSRQLSLVLTTTLASYGHTVRHAIAIDEKQIRLSPSIVQERVDPPQNLQQMWFPGTHQDLGGTMSYFKDKEERSREVSLNQIPLFWMAAEAEKAGLRLDEEGKNLQRGGMPHSGIDLRKQDYKICLSGMEAREMSIRQDIFFSELLPRSERGPIHSELEFGHGWFPPHVCMQKIKNMLYSKSIHRSTALERGQREIPANAAVHASAIRRMKNTELHPAYRPSNLHIADPDSLSISNEEDLVGGYFIYKPLGSGHPQ